MSDRGRLKINPESWHFRWYHEWRRNKGIDKTARSQIDLCHYVRVLLIFGPWRWFWQGRLWINTEPFVWVILLALFGGAVFSFVAWPSGSLLVVGLFGLAALIVATLVGIGYSIRRWYLKDTKAADAFIDRVIDRIETFSYYIFFPLWWPIYWIARGVKAVGIVLGRGIYKAGDTFFTRGLFSVTIDDKLVTFTSFGLVISLCALGGIAAGFYFDPVLMGLIFGGIIGAIALIILIVMLVDRVKKWAKENAAKDALKILEPPQPKEPKEPNVFWAYLVAKKHRVCPLIETEAGGSRK